LAAAFAAFAVVAAVRVLRCRRLYIACCIPLQGYCVFKSETVVDTSTVSLLSPTVAGNDDQVFTLGELPTLPNSQFPKWGIVCSGVLFSRESTKQLLKMTIRTA
jgi:hypothetical protein